MVIHEATIHPFPAQLPQNTCNYCKRLINITTIVANNAVYCSKLCAAVGLIAEVHEEDEICREHLEFLTEDVIGSVFYEGPIRIPVKVRWSDATAAFDEYERAPEGTQEESFGVNVVLWSTWKRVVRRLWEGLMENPHSFEFEEIVNNAVLSYVNRRFEFRADWLITFLELELASCDRKRLRKCAAPDCDSPYFVAGHLRQKYCSDKCAQWAQKTWKKKWWEEHGDEWRRAHAKEQTELLGKQEKASVASRRSKYVEGK